MEGEQKTGTAGYLSLHFKFLVFTMCVRDCDMLNLIWWFDLASKVKKCDSKLIITSFTKGKSKSLCTILPNTLQTNWATFLGFDFDHFGSKQHFFGSVVKNWLLSKVRRSQSLAHSVWGEKCKNKKETIFFCI